jgi:hypothetical protein
MADDLQDLSPEAWNAIRGQFQQAAPQEDYLPPSHHVGSAGRAMTDAYLPTSKSGQPMQAPSHAPFKLTPEVLLEATGPLGDAGTALGEFLRTGQFDARDLAPAAAGVMLGVAGPKGEGVAGDVARGAAGALQRVLPTWEDLGSAAIRGQFQSAQPQADYLPPSQAYAKGGVREMSRDTEGTQDLVGGFGVDDLRIVNVSPSAERSAVALGQKNAKIRRFGQLSRRPPPAQ